MFSFIKSIVVLAKRFAINTFRKKAIKTVDKPLKAIKISCKVVRAVNHKKPQEVFVILFKEFLSAKVLVRFGTISKLAYRV